MMRDLSERGSWEGEDWEMESVDEWRDEIEEKGPGDEEEKYNMKKDKDVCCLWATGERKEKSEVIRKWMQTVRGVNSLIKTTKSCCSRSEGLALQNTRRKMANLAPCVHL